jgi:hypothetical protein
METKINMIKKVITNHLFTNVFQPHAKGFVTHFRPS